VVELSIGRLVRDLAQDGKVVQRVGQVRMERTETSFLYNGGFAQKLFGGCLVAGSSGLFRYFNDGSSSRGSGTESPVRESRGAVIDPGHHCRPALGEPG
jgi:hypothetical protein